MQTLPCLRLLWAGRHTQIFSDPNSCSFSSPWLVLALFPKLLGGGSCPALGAGSSSLSALILAVTLSRLLALNTRLPHLSLCISQVQTSLLMPTLVYPTTHSAATPAVYQASPTPLRGGPLSTDLSPRLPCCSVVWLACTPSLCWWSILQGAFFPKSPPHRWLSLPPHQASPAHCRVLNLPFILLQHPRPAPTPHTF